MELPDDVIRLIREYAKPRFAYVHEYNRILKLHGMPGWPKLKECLLSRPAQILPVLLLYENAHRDFNHNHDETKDTISTRDILNQVHDQLCDILHDAS